MKDIRINLVDSTSGNKDTGIGRKESGNLVKTSGGTSCGIEY